MVENAPAHIAAVIALVPATGLDPSDALHLLRDKIKNGVAWAQRRKAGRDVPHPITGRLRAAPKHDAPAMSWTYDGFSTVWHRWRAKQVEAGHIPADPTLKGLRHTVRTILREGGPDLRQIADLPRPVRRSNGALVFAC